MDYISIAEYAERANISKQTAYNRAKNAKYRGYFRKIRGVLMVDCSLLEVKEILNLNSSLENGADNGGSAFPLNQNSSDNSSIENPLFDLLREQLQNQNKQIESLYAMIAEKDTIIKELSANVAEITAKIQALQHEQHLLEAGKLLNDEETAPAESAPKEESKAETPKKGFFSRFWRRS